MMPKNLSTEPERLGDELVLHVKRKNPLPMLPFPDPDLDRYFNPTFRSANRDDAAARDEIMTAVISVGFDGFAAVPDERFDDIAA